MSSAISSTWQLTVVFVGLLFACSADTPGSSAPDRQAGANPSSSPAADDRPGSSAQGGAGSAASFGNSDGPATEFEALTGPTGSDTRDGGASDACVQDSTEATLEKLPIDIIFTIDTSASMLQEIAGVQNNINDNFASLIGASGIDYRVILISEDEVCIGGALNPNGCGQSSPPTFYFVPQDVGSHDTWCVLLETYPQWRGYLRPEAFKVFVAVTDDSPDCGGLGAQSFGSDQAGAQAFDAALLALDPAQFGSAGQRNYVYHGLVALAENTPATDAYEPTDAIVDAECSTAAGNGAGYQYLSQLTGGLRFPVCEGNNFDAVFKRIAEGITRGAAVACEFEIPDAAADGTPIDRDTIEVAYVPGERTSTIKFARADDVSACANEAFTVEGDRVKLCPAACDAVKLDPGAEVQVLFGCDVCGGLDVDCGTEPPPELPPIE